MAVSTQTFMRNSRSPHCTYPLMGRVTETVATHVSARAMAELHQDTGA